MASPPVANFFRDAARTPEEIIYASNRLVLHHTRQMYAKVPRASMTCTLYIVNHRKTLTSPGRSSMDLVSPFGCVRRAGLLTAYSCRAYLGDPLPRSVDHMTPSAVCLLCCLVRRATGTKQITVEKKCANHADYCLRRVYWIWCMACIATRHSLNIIV